RDALALLRVLQLRVFRRDILGKVALLYDPLGRILVGRGDVVLGDPELGRDRAEQRLRLRSADVGVPALGRDQGGVLPHRLAVAPPVERERPARQSLAWIPFALPVM